MSRGFLFGNLSTMTLRLVAAVVFFVLPVELLSQNADSLTIRKIFTEAMTDTAAYQNLRYLCNHIGGRIGGSPQAAEAVLWAKKVLEGMGIDTVFLQETKVRHWKRGKESLILNPNDSKSQKLNACAIGGTVGTGENGIAAEVVEVYDYGELARLGKENVEGKIVFYNHPPNPAVMYTFPAYGETVRYRSSGAVEAAKYGAKAIIARSATLAHDDFPHTGIMHYNDTVEKIPAMSISNNDADKLSKALKKDPNLTVSMILGSVELPEVTSYNVIGEIRGSDFPEEIIVFGGHLDAWDTGQGAYDDGTGVVQTMDVLRLFKALNMRPKRTLRVVAFMDEEMAQRGAKTYAEFAKTSTTEKHIAGIEADRGGSTPFGFSIDASKEQYEKVVSWKELFYPYGLYYFEKGGSGVDVSGLKPLGTALFGLVTDSQRYFDYHHSPNDTFNHVNVRELQLGSFSLAAFVYLIDEHGL